MLRVAIALLLAMTFSASAQNRDQALIGAAEKGDLAAVERLVRDGASVMARDNRGRTALLARDGADSGRPRRALTGKAVSRAQAMRPILPALRGGAIGGAVPVIGDDPERHLPRVRCLAALEHRIARMRRAHFHRVLHWL